VKYAIRVIIHEITLIAVTYGEEKVLTTDDSVNRIFGKLQVGRELRGHGQ
jgi:hypothetical protein